MEDQKTVDYSALRFAGSMGEWHMGRLTKKGKRKINGGNWDGLCSVFTQMGHTTQECEDGLSNAHLIAAAPRLLSNILAQAAHEATTDEPSISLREEREAIIAELISNGALTVGE